MIEALHLVEAGANLLSGPETNGFSSISIDTRTLKPGALFVAFKGEQTDGHLFIPEALERGARGILAESYRGEVPSEVSLFSCQDTLKTLGVLAHQRRKRFNPTVIAITGSQGKTTTKDLLATILEQKAPVLKTWGNYNNELGLPLTLLELEEEHRYAVLEMGMRGVGQIQELCRLAEPEFGIITNIGDAHLELLGTQERIAQAKGELFTALPQEGAAIINGQDSFAENLGKLHPHPFYFGFNPEFDLWAEPTRGGFFLKTKTDSQKVPFALYGKHNIENALAAAAAAFVLGFSLPEIAAGLGKARATAQRLELKTGLGGYLLLDDTYNASPRSTKRALMVLGELARQEGRRQVAVLGDMLELGPDSRALHQKTGAEAVETALLVTIGELGREIGVGAKEAGHENVVSFETKAQALPFLKKTLAADDLVLIKGSRGLALEELVAAFAGGEEG